MATVGYILSFILLAGVFAVVMFLIGSSRRPRPNSSASVVRRPGHTRAIIGGTAVSLAGGIGAVIFFALGMLAGEPFTAIGLVHAAVAVCGLAVALGAILRSRTA
jgi:hypothetical protein